MRDPNNIDLQSVDPDLQTDDQNPAQQGGVDDLLGYSDAVDRWGEDIVNAFGTNMPAVARSSVSKAKAQPYFHPATRMTTPFVVAGVLVLVILLIVFMPGRE